MTDHERRGIRVLGKNADPADALVAFEITDDLAKKMTLRSLYSWRLEAGWTAPWTGADLVLSTLAAPFTGLMSTQTGRWLQLRWCMSWRQSATS